VLIRPATAGDAGAIAAVYAPYVTDTVVSFEAEPPDAAEMQRRMNAVPRLPWLVAEGVDTVVGFAYASGHRAREGYRWAADCSVYLDGGHRGQGIGRALYEALIPMVRDLGYVTLHAGIALPNDASVGLHERLGFQLVGVYRNVGHKRGEWHDVGWWQLLLRDPPSQPDEPQAWLALDEVAEEPRRATNAAETPVE
jgi:phosphinothricin acetyltransferase